uniref:Galectin n=1 Tax=Seriola dumerili TaxID=41447 RepID=A0A3B4UR11_SERDU
MKLFETLNYTSVFQIDLGCDADDLALHFNPRFHDDTDGAVLVCNSKTDGCWGDEKREIHNPLQRGADVKVIVLCLCREIHVSKV